ncbi:uncharacterized protein TNCV_4949591 [Trichonephila clavipes]|nr:uncharacterized protein TNCV_4949591 [Trichonephila clavipes]
MAPHTITPAVGAVCRCKAKAGLRRSPRGLHTRLSSLLRLNLNSSLKTTSFLSAAVQFLRARHHSKRKGGSSTRNVLYPGTVREDTGAPNEGATYAWIESSWLYG